MFITISISLFQSVLLCVSLTHSILLPIVAGVWSRYAKLQRALGPTSSWSWAFQRFSTQQGYPDNQTAGYW